MHGRTVTVYPNELYHHGILGQKWGIRRFQNPDGTRTAAGKKREKENSPSEKKKLNKKDAVKIAVGAASTAAIVAGAIYYSKHPDEVKAFIRTAVSELKYDAKYGKIAKGKEFIHGAGAKAANAVKEGLKEAPNNFASGIKEGITGGAKTSGKIIATGVTMLAAKEVVDIVAGKKDAERIYKASNKKKVDSFWKSYNDSVNNNKKKSNSEDEDDDD